MRKNFKTWGLRILFQIALVHVFLVELGHGSVLPRPNIRQRSTTQIANLNTYTGEKTIVIVTSSELPKQIPPPPTPTKPHKPTPKYDVTASTRESFYNKNKLHNKELFPSFHLMPE